MTLSKNAAYWLIGYAILIVMTGANIPSPLYDVYMRLWHFSPSMLTLIFATYIVFLIPALLFSGRVSDRFGRRRVLIVGLFVAAFGTAIFSLAHSIAWLFAARAVQGLAVGILSGAAAAALLELQLKQDRRHAALITSVATAGGTALGPMLSGVLAQYVPAPLITPYAVQLALLFPAIVGSWAIPETAMPAPQSSGVARGLGVPVAIRRAFILASATAFIAWAVTALFMALMPSYVAHLLDVRNIAVGGMSVFAMLAASAVTQIALSRFPTTPAIVAGLALLTLGLIGVLSAVPAHSLYLLFISTLVAGAGQGLSFRGSAVMINEIAPPEQRASILSSFYVIIYLGVGLPILGLGFAGTLIGLYRAIVGFTVFVATISTVIVYNLIRGASARSVPA